MIYIINGGEITATVTTSRSGTRGIVRLSINQPLASEEKSFEIIAVRGDVEKTINMSLMRGTTSTSISSYTIYDSVRFAESGTDELVFDETTETECEYLISASHAVDLDGADTLSMTVGAPYVDLIDDYTRLRHNGQIYNITSYQKDMEGRTPTCSIESEHISYELNDPQYNLSAFALLGTPEEILTAALVGTPYTVGTVEPTTVRTIAMMEESSRRAIIFTIAALCEAEITYSGDGRTVNLVNHRGSVEPVDPFELDTVETLSISRDKLAGTTSYTITTGKKSTLQCGDNLHLAFEPYDLDVDTRIIAMQYNPYTPFEVSIEVGDHVPDIVDSFVDESKDINNIIQTFSVRDGEFISRTQVLEFVSSIEQSAERISWLVESGTGISSFVLTDQMLALVSQNITINGFVTFADLEATGTTSISGSFIRTNHLLGQSGNTGLELDAPTAGGEITATCSQGGSGIAHYIRVQLSSPSLEDRTFDVIGTTSQGAKMRKTVPISAGQTSASVTDVTVYVSVVFALSGTTTYIFSDTEVYGVSCTGDFVPSQNSTGASTGYALGTSAKNWKIGYIYSGIVQGSARKYKKDIRDLNSKHIKLFDNLRPRSFLFRNGESGRRHYGFIVDEVKDAIDAAGLTSENCAAYVLDDPEDPTGGGGLRYEEFVPVLVAKIKDLETKLKEMEERT